MQTAQSDDWRPGFAKRAENFSEVCASAETWRWSPGETIARVAGAVLKGTPTLSIQQRMTLLLYVDVQRIYEAAFEALLAAVSTGEAVAFAAVRAPKVRVTLRLPKEVCERVRACLTRLTLKLTDFACAAVGRFLAAQGD